MIEVEIRGRLTEEKFSELKQFFTEKGGHIESHTREMIRLYDYPGFAEDSNKREVDIRVRDTDGKCEIMVKRKAAENNVARHELSLKLADGSMEAAKEVLKALGYAKGLWMHRKKDVFEYEGVEWSLVEAPSKIFYFEAEMEASDAESIPATEKQLRAKAQELGLEVLGPEAYLKLIAELGEKTNKVITW